MFPSGRYYRAILAIAGLAIAVVAVAAGAHRSRTKPCPVCAIPAARYPQPAAAPAILAISNVAVPLVPVDPLVAENGQNVIASKMFQWKEPSFTIAHCMISRPALVMYADGTWTMSLRADQNPVPPPDLPAPFNPTAHIRRNLFQVKMRCFATEGASDDAVLNGVGHPSVAELEPAEFVVERGEPAIIRLSGRWDWQRQADSNAFENMDRAELEFVFR
jgi:hypothetical protein